MVRRLDRHVPLHVGGLNRKTGAFEEFFCTHGDNANRFDMARYQQLRTEIEKPPEKDRHALAAKLAQGRTLLRGLPVREINGVRCILLNFCGAVRRGEFRRGWRVGRGRHEVGP